MRTRTREWWLSLPVQAGLAVLLTSLLVSGYRDFDPINVGALTGVLLGAVLIEEYRIARLSDKLNSLENKPEGKMRFW